MKTTRFYVFLFASLLMTFKVNCQIQKDFGRFVEYKPGYYQNFILKGIEEFESKDKVVKPNLIFKADISRVEAPKAVSEFKTFWHNEPISQGNTGTCWCFSTTSYFESEVYRLSGQKVKLSEIYTVYWEYVEKARRFVRERGNSAFEEGSEANAVTRIWKTYGIIPQKDYPGLLAGQTYHNHEPMMKEMKDYLNSVKSSNAWDEETILKTIKSIMNHYIGEPPTSVNVDGKTFTPQQYLKDVLKLKMDDYIDVLSIMQEPYWEKTEYKVPDNWWHSKDYYNIPLEDFMAVVKNSIKNGYTIGIGGDVSEAGFVASSNIAIIPSFDIPAQYIDESSRQFRFSNSTTTDDHGMQIVGFTDKNGVTWYLVKDSSSGSRFGGKDNNKFFGYYLFREDYVKLKIMDFIVHKDMMKDYLPKFSK